MELDDLRIVPRTPTTVASRADVDTTCRIGSLALGVPIIVSSMHALCSADLIANVERAGGAVVQPRDVFLPSVRPGYSVGLDGPDHDYHDFGIVIAVEIANGHMARLAKRIETLRAKFPQADIWAGTVCTRQGTRILRDAGATAVLAGIGVGEACTTTWKTGVGLPLVDTLEDCVGHRVPIITSGGLRSPGDFVKALALGATACMSGSLFKGCRDARFPDRYYGEASAVRSRENIEGKIINLGPVNDRARLSSDVVKELAEGLRSAMSYSDSRTLDEFRRKVQIRHIV